MTETSFENDDEKGSFIVIDENGLLNGNGNKRDTNKNTDQIRQNGKTENILNMNLDPPQIKLPPDGGARAWAVMISAFICVGIIFGIINTYSIFYIYIQNDLEGQGDPDASSKAAIVGSLTVGTTFLLSPISGILVDKIGLRKTTCIGGVLASGGMLLSSFYTHNIQMLYFSYGIMFGLGSALAYTPSLAILGHYFKQYLGVINGLVTAGSSVFTAALPLALNYCVHEHGLPFTLRILSGVSVFMVLCGFIFKPLNKHVPVETKKENKSGCHMVTSLIYMKNWKNKKYLIWFIAFPIALFGYFVPYVHIAKYVQDQFPGYDENLPIICLGIFSGVGRIVFGFIGDLPCVNRVLLQQAAIALIGIFTMLIPATNSYFCIIFFISMMGLFDGCFISMIGPIAYDLCGPSGATQAMGFLFGLCSFPLTLGPPIAGMIYDHTNSYKLPFILCGISPILSALLMFLMKCVKDDKGNDCITMDPSKEPLARSGWDSEGGRETSKQNGSAIRNGDLNHNKSATAPEKT